MANPLTMFATDSNSIAEQSNNKIQNPSDEAELNITASSTSSKHDATVEQSATDLLGVLLQQRLNYR